MENKKQEKFYSKIFKKPFIQKIFLIKIGRIIYLLTTLFIITLIYIVDKDALSFYLSTLLDIIVTLIFIFITIWRLNDIGWPKWWASSILILFGVLSYIDHEIIATIEFVLLTGIVVVLSYFPRKITGKLESGEVTSNIMIKNKIFNKQVFLSFVLGLIIMFGIGYAYFSYIKNNNCLFSNVGIVEIFGEIDLFEDPDYASTSALNVIQQIEALGADSSIKGIVLDISSGGGGIESSESIMLAVQRTSKPVVAVIRDMGASGAYLIATAADRIYASRLSDVGSIGVTMDFLDTSEKDRREGVILYDFSSGKYKGVFKDHSKMTQEQREMIMKGIMQSHDVFVEYVSNSRNIPLEEVKKIATGESWGGDDALKLKLIDQIGGMHEATAWLQTQISEELSFCSLGE